MNGKILIIEDETKLSEVMTLYLSKENYEVTCVNDGMEAEDVINNNSFDLILLDIMLPGMSGHELLHEFRKQNDTPILMMTALSDDESQIRAFDAHADDYVIKPF